MVELTSKTSSDGSAGIWRRDLAPAVSVLTGAVVVVAFLTAFEAARWSMPMLPNQAPVLDLYGYGRSALAALLSLAIVVALAGRTPLAARKPLSVPQTATVVFSLGLLGLFLAMFLLSPALFNRMSLEDGPVEWASALLPIAASFLLFWRAARLVKVRERRVSWVSLPLGLSALVLLVLGMEETSWMQRVFGLHTPEILSGNIQHELNLHNLATNQVGTLHKIAGFVLLIFLPFIHATAASGVKVPGLSALIPSRCAALTGAPLAASNYNCWDFLPMQMTAYLTVAIVVLFAWQAWRRGRIGEMALCAAMAIAIAAAQILFIVLGDRFIRIWDVTEYKELFIALGLFVWALEVFHRLATRTTAAVIRS